MSDSTDIWFPTKIKFPEECSGLLNHQDSTIYPNHCNLFHSKIFKPMNKHWLRLSILQKLSNADNPEAEKLPIPWKSLQSWFQNWLSFTLVLTFSCSAMCYYSLLSCRALPPPFSLTCYPLYITTKKQGK